MSDHYKNSKPEYEVIEIIKNTMTKEELDGYLKGNVLKYVFRAGKKKGSTIVEDLNKAGDYLIWWQENNIGN